MSSKWLLAWLSSSQRERSPWCGGADEPAGSLRPPVSHAGGSCRRCPGLGEAQGLQAVRAQASDQGIVRRRSWAACGLGSGIKLVAPTPSPHRAVGNRTSIRSSRLIVVPLRPVTWCGFPTAGFLVSFRLALIQLHVSSVKSDNITRACSLVREAAKQGANIISLPECFNSPYGTNYFPEYAEKIPGETTQKLSEVAKESSIYLIGGSIPEEDAGKLYNTCPVFGPDGNLLVKHKKIHLFDIDVPGKITFQESKTLSPGDSFSTFDTPYCRVGLGICYDMRFAELAQIYAQRGCQLLVYPGAFNLTTGPAHWELLQRARAVDNQVYVATASPARDDKASYVVWGHSTVVDPWGQVLTKAGTEETILYSDIDLKKLAEIRQQIPILKQKRADLYTVETKKP